MTVSPDSEMFSDHAPEFDEDRAIAEITKEMGDVGADDQEVLRMLDRLLTHPDESYPFTTTQGEFIVRRGLNQRFWLEKISNLT